MSAADRRAVDASGLVVRRSHGHIVWSPELVEALREGRRAGMSLEALALEYGIGQTAIKRHVDPAPADYRSTISHKADYSLVMRAPAVPPHMGRPALPCGCRRGEPCEVAQTLKLAYEAETFGTRSWATKRQEWVRHVSGEREAQT